MIAQTLFQPCLFAGTKNGLLNVAGCPADPIWLNELVTEQCDHIVVGPPSPPLVSRARVNRTALWGHSTLSCCSFKPLITAHTPARTCHRGALQSIGEHVLWLLLHAGFFCWLKVNVLLLERHQPLTSVNTCGDTLAITGHRACACEWDITFRTQIGVFHKPLWLSTWSVHLDGQHEAVSPSGSDSKFPRCVDLTSLTTTGYSLSSACVL